jgi:hypothetical protein
VSFVFWLLVFGIALSSLGFGLVAVRKGPRGVMLECAALQVFTSLSLPT